MKKMLMIGLVGLVVLAAGVQAADNYQEFTIVVTNGQTSYNTEDFRIAGLLDKVEYIKTGVSTCTVTVGSFSDTTLVDTYAAKQITGASAGVLARPRVIGTTTAGVALTASTNAVGVSATVLTVPYERIRIGGNAKVRIASDGDGGVSTNKIRVYLVP